MRPAVVTVLVRLLGIVVGLLVLGIVVRLFGAVLRPALPPLVMAGLDAGWRVLIKQLTPSLGPIMAVLILAVLGWLLMGYRQ